MRVLPWGVRGSLPVPGPGAARYGGNTPCLQVTLADGSVLVLDAGTGISPLGRTLAAERTPLHVLLSHLHLDHIQGLLFFAPLFQTDREVTVWGPTGLDGPLQDRLGRYLSQPLSPVDIRQLPAQVTFRICPPEGMEIGSAHVQTALVNHRGPTLGLRITDDDGEVLCYIPDHEPALGPALDRVALEWISGGELASGASLLIHDGQYTEREYAQHVGWGHSSAVDALRFARRVEAKRVLLFHHDPLHDDAQLDELAAGLRERWADLGGPARAVELAVEGREVVVGAAPTSA